MHKRSKPVTYAKHAIKTVRDKNLSHHYPDIDADERRLQELGNTYLGIPEDELPDPIQVELQNIAQRYLPTTFSANLSG